MSTAKRSVKKLLGKVFKSSRLKSGDRWAIKFTTPENYWFLRHKKLEGEFRSSGHTYLTDEENKADYDMKRREIQRVLTQHKPAGKCVRLLDAGCGTGLFMPVFLDLGFEVTGMDFASPQAGRSPNLAGVNIIEGDICELPVEAASFDVIACIDVLFHVIDNTKWRSFFDNVASALTPNGILIIQVALSEDENYQGVVRHCHMRRRRDYDSATEAAGFQLLEAHRYTLPVEPTHKDILVYSRKVV
ncbi:MAG: class I SAM-dependent methyltransferase [Planctomycetota bacterium]|nr:class I SAM-dependent methyltransferase [Planctomycetota bacterium]